MYAHALSHTSSSSKRSVPFDLMTGDMELKHHKKQPQGDTNTSTHARAYVRVFVVSLVMKYIWIIK